MLSANQLGTILKYLKVAEVEALGKGEASELETLRPLIKHIEHVMNEPYYGFPYR